MLLLADSLVLFTFIVLSPTKVSTFPVDSRLLFHLDSCPASLLIATSGVLSNASSMSIKKGACCDFLFLDEIPKLHKSGLGLCGLARSVGVLT